MVIDKENIENLAGLSRFAIDRGWTKSPFFKTQIGRNYELHFCNSTPEKLFDRATLYKHLYELLKVHPYIAEFINLLFQLQIYLRKRGTSGATVRLLSGM